MTKEEALKFLLKHQPMPSDKDLTKDIIDRYDDVRKFFIQHPDSEAIKLFLRSFGDGDGWGVYQLVEDFFYQCPEPEVKREIKKVLEDVNISDGVRYWSTQIAAAFNDEMLRDGLEISLKSKNPDISDAAEIALGLL
ncbi:hypothetical protein [uncultured Pluralibacter sp.]|uniref:hypothetical protein n=1 Tax=uncultured Pluralibacter sp. TaxID=1490864 RepID=UPI002631090F|nr:hypothetical protein [uncultured Pluralibacter sp.]